VFTLRPGRGALWAATAQGVWRVDIERRVVESVTEEGAVDVAITNDGMTVASWNALHDFKLS
jgi:hypothetical protein